MSYYNIKINIKHTQVVIDTCNYFKIHRYNLCKNIEKTMAQFT